MVGYRFLNNNKKECVLCIHGLGGSSIAFKRQFNDLNEHYNILNIDLPGHGFAQEFSLHIQDKKYNNFNVIAEDILRVMDAIGIEKAHFIGLSLGCIFVTVIGKLAPDRVSSQLLVGAALKFPKRFTILFNIGNVFKKIVPCMILYKFFAWVICPYRSHKKSREIFIQEAKKLKRLEFLEWYNLVRHYPKEVDLESLIKTDIPRLYVMGEEDHLFLNTVYTFINKDNCGKLTVIPKCGHLANIQKPDKFNLIMMNFLEGYSRKENQILKEIAVEK